MFCLEFCKGPLPAFGANVFVKKQQPQTAFQVTAVVAIPAPETIGLFVWAICMCERCKKVSKRSPQGHDTLSMLCPIAPSTEL